MSLVQTIDEVDYPESDGKPMGETDIHIEWIIRIRDILRWRYRDQRVYVASDMLVYYVEGEPTKFAVPDNFVVLDCEPKRRRTFKIWEEGRSPDVVFELTSRGSRREDEVFKPKTYAQIGVNEYFLYDPEGEYLQPPLQGFQLQEDDYVRIEPDETGNVKCNQLGISLKLHDGKLVITDSNSGVVLTTEAEAQSAELDRERAARQQAEAARDEAQLELQQLREELKRKDERN